LEQHEGEKIIKIVIFGLTITFRYLLLLPAIKNKCHMKHIQIHAHKFTLKNS